MNHFIFNYETPLRLGFFFGTLAFMGILELLIPRRKLTVSKGIRWLNNIGLVFLNSLILRWLFPAAAIGVAMYVEKSGWGLFYHYTIPSITTIVLSIVIMDLIIYLQHVLFHAVPALWQLHRVHHADLDCDVTTGARFHPLEIVLSMLIKFAMIIFLGIPAMAVLIFEIILNTMAMFNHANIQLSIALDRHLRWLIVTPNMHRIHHSIEADETNSNFGFNLSWWDRLLGTYCNNPRKGYRNMTIGLCSFRDIAQVGWLPGILMLPFQKEIAGYAINRRQWEGTSNES